MFYVGCGFFRATYKCSDKLVAILGDLTLEMKR
jgi:hypothetical protein